MLQVVDIISNNIALHTPTRKLTGVACMARGSAFSSVCLSVCYSLCTHDCYLTSLIGGDTTREKILSTPDSRRYIRESGVE